VRNEEVNNFCICFSQNLNPPVNATITSYHGPGRKTSSRVLSLYLFPYTENGTGSIPIKRDQAGGSK